MGFILCSNNHYRLQKRPYCPLSTAFMLMNIRCVLFNTCPSACEYQGSARQLFQHLRRPFEEETLRAHFEKIVVLGQKLHQSCRKVRIIF
jgi:hypothetical protein